jgi:hypothetical protein
MKKLTLGLLALASFVGTTGVASAQYYYGGGYYYDHPRYYRDYDDYHHRRGYGYGGAIVGQNIYGRPEAYYPVGRGGRCPRHYTVQDGLCKPYRGF